MTDIYGLAGAASAYFTPSILDTNSGGGANSNSGSAAPIGQVSTTISGPGQLLADLQQLQTQDPTKFKQVASQIADQLQAAAQQKGATNEGDFLNKLAGDFKNAANGGDVSQVKPHHHGGHHGHHTYNSNGQAVAPSSGTSSSLGSDLQSLLTTITSEVTKALGVS